MTRVIAPMVVLFACSLSLHAETVDVPITADVGICAHPQETAINTGGRGMVRVKGIEHYYLFDFDCTKLKGRRVTKATLSIMPASGNLRKVGFCTVPVAWVEGTATDKPQNGSTCYTHTKYPDVPWTNWGGNMLDATFNNPAMRWRGAKVEHEKNWLRIEIDPLLVQAVVEGLSHGLVMSDECGQTMENHDIYTREQGNSKPYLTVESEEPKPLPTPRPGTYPASNPRPMVEMTPLPQATDTKSSAVMVKVNLTDGCAGARVKGLGDDFTVFTDKPVIVHGLAHGKKYQPEVSVFWGGREEKLFPGWVKAPDAPKMPVPAEQKPPQAIKRQYRDGQTVLELHAPSANISPLAQPLTEDKGFVLPVTAANAWASVQVAVFAPAGAEKEFQLSMPAFKADDGSTADMRASAYRVWAVSDGKDYHGDALVPLANTASFTAGLTVKFAVPWAQNKVAGQTCQAVLLDIWVPKTTKPGIYKADIELWPTKIVVPVEVRVLPVTLSDDMHIVGDCNTYDSPAYAAGVKDSDVPAFLRSEQDYYHLAHAHRMTLNVLHYSHAGELDWRGGPKIEKADGNYKMADWSQWDERFGPLLSGEAFGAKSGYVGPGAGRPIHHMYLPIHENWPVPLADAFKPWPPPRDYQQFLKWTADLPDVAACLGDQGGAGLTRAGWNSVMADFAKHLAEKGWTKTDYQIYLNNKHYYRDPKQGGRGITLWLLDEPMFSWDFAAVGYFGRMARDAMAPPKAVAGTAATATAGSPDMRKLFEFRVDNSRPGYQRDFLDGATDLNVVPGQLYAQRRLVEYRRIVHGERFWNYAMPQSFGASNVGWAAWPVVSYCWGATGTLPWQTIGSDGSYDKAEATCLMYPGTRVGAAGPVASLRMKAWRDGLQDAELLHMLRTKKGWNDAQLRAWVAMAMGIPADADAGIDPKADSAIVTFKDVSPAMLESLRRATLLALTTD